MMNLTDFRIIRRALNEHPSCEAKSYILSHEIFEDEDAHLASFIDKDGDDEWKSQHWEVFVNAARNAEVSNRLLVPLQEELEFTLQEERKATITRWKESWGQDVAEMFGEDSDEYEEFEIYG
jgi:hypothetical protein